MLKNETFVKEKYIDISENTMISSLKYEISQEDIFCGLHRDLVHVRDHARNKFTQNMRKIVERVRERKWNGKNRIIQHR